MTKTEAMQNALCTICVAEIEEDITQYTFLGYRTEYMLSLFTGENIETAKRVLEKFCHGLVDGTSMEIVELIDSYCVRIEWQWR